MACRHKTATAPCICCVHAMIRGLVPPRRFGCESPFLHPDLSFIATSNTLRFEHTCIPELSFLVATDYISTPGSTYSPFTERKLSLHHSHFHFALCAPFWPVESTHPSCFMKAFIPSRSLPLSKGNVENKCELLRAEHGVLEPTQAGSR